VLAVLLVALGALILVAELVRHHAGPDAALLLGILVPVTLAGRWLVRDLRLHPAGFPEPTPSHGLALKLGGRPSRLRD
jgi:hypothetical protein